MKLKTLLSNLLRRNFLKNVQRIITFRPKVTTAKQSRTVLKPGGLGLKCSLPGAPLPVPPNLIFLTNQSQLVELMQKIQ